MGWPALTSNSPPFRDGLVVSARREFDFLAASGFLVELEDRPDISVLAFIDSRATFEVEFDWREQSVFLLVGRTMGGRRPPGYYVHQGKRVRVHLLQALIEIEALDDFAKNQLRRGTRESGAEAMKSQVAMFAEVLRARLSEVLTRIEMLFPG